MKRSLMLSAVIVPLAAYAYACGSDAAPVGAVPEGGSDAPTTPPPDADLGTDASPITDAGADGAPVTCTNRNPLKNPYFGDLHAHTSYSFDAFTFDTRNTPFDAYAFAKGKTVQVAGAGPDGGGPMTTIERPLDFLAVTDHSEWLALAYGCGDLLGGGPQGTPKSPYYDDPTCVLFRSTDPTQQTKNFAGARLLQQKLCGDAGGNDCQPVIQSAWQSEQAAAAAAYEPCKFTSLIAYEYTRSLALDAGNATLHKNVIFGSDKVPAQPIDAFNNPTQVELWTALDQQCLADAGCQAITIPHNSNLSQGAAFIAAAGAEQQMSKYQRLVEIFQHKGGSECFYDPANPTDPDCNFEYLGGVTEPNLPRSYVRTGLKEGLVAYATSATKTNPLQMGIVAATDDHNGAPGNTREDTWPGHAGRLDDTPGQRIGLKNGADNGVSHGHNPGGLAVVWAEQNTRDAVFAALYRRETYGTSGTRIVVRFYQTWDQGADPCADPNFPASLVAAGAVPMGGNMAPPPGGGDAAAASPRFVVYAWKDKTDLARIDLVKAWVDATGQAREKVVPFPLAAGAPACVSWTDPAFTGTASFYYARVLEQPTDRWSVQDCKADQTANPAGCANGGYLAAQIQERAWTSPIWWLP
jgi:hypothetical protein